uniref:Glycoside hydrolase family 3 C-terminal domain-containing protein n=1 Tax=Populus trichocarpa TaxID=3694 RepID=A0A3N7FJA8_POPTR
MDRIDDAVMRILRVKFTLCLFETPLADETLVDQLGSQAHRDLAREAVRKSPVLLKNGENADDPVLPLPKKASRILVAGIHANNMGYQCGGWTATWQGVDGNNYTAVVSQPQLIQAQKSFTARTLMLISSSSTTSLTPLLWSERLLMLRQLETV